MPMPSFKRLTCMWINMPADLKSEALVISSWKWKELTSPPTIQHLSNGNRRSKGQRIRLAVLSSGPWVVLMLWFLGNAVGFLNCSLYVGKALQCWVGIQLPEVFTELFQGSQLFNAII